MGYFKKGTIRRIVIAGVLVFSLTYCGSTAVSVKEKTPENETAKVLDNEGKEDKNQKAEVSETPKAAPETSGNKTSEEERTEISCTSERPISDIPVYSAEDKKEVKDYLGGLPNRYLTYEEAVEWGMIQRIWWNSKEDKKQQKKFDKQWLDFYQLVTRNDLKWNVNKGEIYHDLAVEKALVLLSYTVEGDPIYDYISCINGDYYFYSDSSKDEYGGGYYDGSYKDLRAINEKDEEGNEYSSFYLVRDKKITDKEIKKMIQSEEGYDLEEITEVYSLDYVLEDF